MSAGAGDPAAKKAEVTDESPGAEAAAPAAAAAAPAEKRPADAAPSDAQPPKKRGRPKGAPHFDSRLLLEVSERSLRPRAAETETPLISWNLAGGLRRLLLQSKQRRAAGKT